MSLNMMEFFYNQGCQPVTFSRNARIYYLTIMFIQKIQTFYTITCTSSTTFIKLEISQPCQVEILNPVRGNDEFYENKLGIIQSLLNIFSRGLPYIAFLLSREQSTRSSQVTYIVITCPIFVVQLRCFAFINVCSEFFKIISPKNLLYFYS